MLLELYERLRGYDKWVEAEARIESSNVEKIPVTDRYGNVVSYNYDANDMLAWSDAAGEKHYADFTVDDGNPLYQYVDGESLAIRVNPAAPDNFYHRDLLRAKIRKVVVSTTVVVFGLLLFALTIWARTH